MNQKTHRIFVRSVVVAVLMLFLAPFSIRSDGMMGMTVNGLGSAIGGKSSVQISYTMTDKNTGETHTFSLGPTRPELFATAALLSAVAALVFSWMKRNPARLLVSLASIGCVVFLWVWKERLGGQIAKTGFGIISVGWGWGFWAALVAAFVAAGLPLVPATPAAIPEAPTSGAAADGPTGAGEDLAPPPKVGGVELEMVDEKPGANAVDLEDRKSGG